MLYYDRDHLFSAEGKKQLLHRCAFKNLRESLSKWNISDWCSLEYETNHQQLHYKTFTEGILMSIYVNMSTYIALFHVNQQSYDGLTRFQAFLQKKLYIYLIYLFFIFIFVSSFKSSDYFCKAAFGVCT